MDELQIPIPNPYQPPSSIENEPTGRPSYIRVAAGSIVFLFGLAVFGLGVFGTWKTIETVTSTAAVQRLPTMIAVSAMYLIFGLSFFASSRFLFLRRVRMGVFFFIVPLAVFCTLLAILGV